MSLRFLDYPSSSEDKSAIVFLHGLGAGADDFADLPTLLSLGDGLRYVFPQAPSIPVTVNGGMAMPAWYDITSMDFEREADPQTVADSVKGISELLDRIIAGGIAADRIVLGGFSQGGAMALEVGMNYPQGLAGVIVLSAYCLSPDRLTAGDYHHRGNLPLLFCHGKRDEVVPFELGDRHRRLFQKRGFRLEWYEEERLGHQLSPGEVDAMKRWLTSRFSQVSGG